MIHALGTRNRASRMVVSCLIDKVKLAVLYLTGCRELSNRQGETHGGPDVIHAVVDS